MILLFWTGLMASAQEEAYSSDSLQSDNDTTSVILTSTSEASALPTDTLSADSLTTPPLLLTKDEVRSLTQANKPRFTPKPQRALWLALLIPGAGQIYNRKYWKLPIVYGGVLGCLYAFTWNQQMYTDYSQAYLDIMDSDPNTKSYEGMLPPRYDIKKNEEMLKGLFKRKKDYYKRYRDLSAFCFVGVYLISVIDAYVDAQLSEFNISEDLSMRVKPALIDNGPTERSSSFGIGCSLNF